MNLIFWSALIFLILTLPALILITAFYLISKKFYFGFKVVGYLKFKDLIFLYENESIQINLKLENFQIYLIWLRCRIFFKGLVLNIVVNNRTLLFIKLKPVNKAEFMDTFGINKII